MAESKEMLLDVKLDLKNIKNDLLKVCTNDAFIFLGVIGGGGGFIFFG